MTGMPLNDHIVADAIRRTDMEVVALTGSAGTEQLEAARAELDQARLMTVVVAEITALRADVNRLLRAAEED